MTEKMKEVLLYCLAEEYAFYPEDYSKRTIRALEKKGLLDVDDDWYEITEKGNLKVTHSGKRSNIKLNYYPS